MAIPTVVDVTAKVAGTGDVVPNSPTHQADDILVVEVESANETIALGTAEGFVEAPNSPQGTGTAGGTNGTRLARFWKRAASSSDPMPTITDPGNHALCYSASFRGCITTEDPWDTPDATAGDTGASSTDVAVPGGETTGPDRLIVASCSVFTDNNTGQFPNEWINSDLANVTSRVNIGTNLGNGGGIGMATGEKATAGPFGATTTTINNAASQARIMGALKPPSVATTPQAVAATAVGVATLALLMTYSRALVATAVGTSVLTRLMTYSRTLAPTAVGVVSLTRLVTYGRVLAAVATGTATLTKGMFQSLTVTAVGVADLTTALLFQMVLAVGAVGSATLAVLQVIGQSIAATSVGVATVQMATITVKTLVAVALGVANLATQFIAGSGGGGPVSWYPPRARHHRRRR